MQNILVTLAFIVLSYEAVKCANIATHKPAAQSSMFEELDASRAVDGDKSRDMLNVRSCSHTAFNQKMAWWQVDLEKTYIITSVTITPRQWNDSKYRLAGYSIHVSNFTRVNQRDILTDATLCYNYSSTSPPNIDNDLVAKCSAPVTGRFVFIYNERQGDRNYPTGWSTNAILELCEVEVSIQECPVHCDGCPCNTCRMGWYGENCEQSCINCAGKGTCNKENGYCTSQSCKDGFHGLMCTNNCSKQCGSETCDFISGFCYDCNGRMFGVNCGKRCPSNCLQCYNESSCGRCDNGWFGDTCRSNCTHCGGDSACNQNDGSCLSLSCKVGHYGRYCNSTCSEHCTGDRSCDVTTGQCGACPDGLYGVYCQMKCLAGCKTCNNSFYCYECNPGMYGSQCNLSCPGCGGNGSCFISNGRCISDSCKTGYYGGGGRCHEICPTNCGGDESCDVTSGDCLQGCVNGFTGPRCNITCPTNCGGDRSCDVNNQTCLHGCKPGWRGAHCDSECDTGWFGMGCSQSCDRCRNNSCNHITGFCQEGCLTGWSSSMCDVAITTQTSETRTIPAVLGGTIAFLFVLVVTLVIWVIFLKRRRKKERKKNETYVSTMFTTSSADGHVYDSMHVKKQRGSQETAHDEGGKKSEYRNETPDESTSFIPITQDKTYYEMFEA